MQDLRSSLKTIHVMAECIQTSQTSQAKRLCCTMAPLSLCPDTGKPRRSQWMMEASFSLCSDMGCVQCIHGISRSFSRGWLQAPLIARSPASGPSRSRRSLIACSTLYETCCPLYSGPSQGLTAAEDLKLGARFPLVGSGSSGAFTQFRLQVYASISLGSAV